MSAAATIGLLFPCRCPARARGTHGISHFIEHAVLKGTGRRSALEIAIEQDRLGGELDAFTTHEETGFAIKVIDDQLPKAFDLIAGHSDKPAFVDKAELKSEQKVIIEEMKMIGRLARGVSRRDIQRGVFSRLIRLASSIAGTPIDGQRALTMKRREDITPRF